MTDREQNTSTRYTGMNHLYIYKISLNCTSTDSCSVLYLIKQSHERCKGELGPVFDPLKIKILCDVKMPVI